ncbi:MAG: hypothetical protein K1Y01_11010 [Vicinamibacteria bacterium]|nr:hypothetical protein [Vicinamibacteria bacterium]
MILAPGRGVLAQPSPPPPTVEPLIEVRVAGDSLKRVLSVDVAWPSGLKPRFPRDEASTLSGRSVAPVGASKSGFVPIDQNPDWASACEREGCRLAYSVDVARGIATDRRGDWGFEEKQRIVMAPLVRWLVRPEDRRARGRLRVDFDGGKNFELVSGVMDGRVNHIETDLVVMDGPHVVLGDFTHRAIDLPGGRIDVALGRGERGVRDEDLLTWIREGAQDVVSLLGRFPVSRLQVIVASGGPYAVGSAVTMGMGGASIFVVVGERTRKADLLRDWVMTHEMLHVAFPNMGFRQRWMEEGLSTYLEPLLRARRGRYEPQKMWAEFVRAMPQGLPKDGDQGLDRTFTWGRRYWGGAMFWLHVDLEIRRRTEGARSLDDVLRGVLGAGGNVALRWDVARLAGVAENASGTTALREIYDDWSEKAVAPDLGALWTSLGVRADKAERITFDDQAPLARIRRGLTHKGGSLAVASSGGPS